jgi:hypothetical protein
MEHPFPTECKPAATAALAHFGSRWRVEGVDSHAFSDHRTSPTGGMDDPFLEWLSAARRRLVAPQQNLVPIHLSTSVAEARRDPKGRVALRLLVCGKERCITVDHVVAGTGYDIDVERLAFLDAQVRGSIDRKAGGPKLNSRFESSVAGLHFIGPLSQTSFGPLFRFVVGADYTARKVSAYLAGSRT